VYGREMGISRRVKMANFHKSDFKLLLSGIFLLFWLYFVIHLCINCT